MLPRPALLVLVGSVLAACGGAPATTGGVEADGMSGAEGEWVDLFDGETLDSWHGYASDDVSDKWSVEGGVMTLTPDGGEWDGDLVAPGGPYADFELEVEWQIQACGNSGIFYRGEEDADARADLADGAGGPDPRRHVPPGRGLPEPPRRRALRPLRPRDRRARRGRRLAHDADRRRR